MKLERRTEGSERRVVHRTSIGFVRCLYLKLVERRTGWDRRRRVAGLHV